MVKPNEKKRWQLLAIIGTIFMATCLIVSIFQYFIIKCNSNWVLTRYAAVSINSVAFFGFVCLIFSPMDFWIYSIVFYIYGAGNFFDSGNILGALCIFLSMIFLNKVGFFHKKKPLKIALLSIIPTFGLFLQIRESSFVFFLVSLFHIFGLGFLLITLYTIFHDKLSNIQNIHDEIKLSEDICTEEEIEWLTMLANGEKYISISKKFNISESKVKQRVLELYRVLGAHNKNEFLTMYHGCSFSIKKSNSDQ